MCFLFSELCHFMACAQGTSVVLGGVGVTGVWSGGRGGEQEKQPGKPPLQPLRVRLCPLNSSPQRPVCLCEHASAPPSTALAAQASRLGGLLLGNPKEGDGRCWMPLLANYMLNIDELNVLSVSDLLQWKDQLTCFAFFGEKLNELLLLKYSQHNPADSFPDLETSLLPHTLPLFPSVSLLIILKMPADMKHSGCSPSLVDSF